MQNLLAIPFFIRKRHKNLPEIFDMFFPEAKGPLGVPPACADLRLFCSKYES